MTAASAKTGSRGRASDQAAPGKAKPGKAAPEKGAAGARPSLKERINKDSFFQTSADLPRIVELDLDAIAPDPAQPRQRFDEDGLDDLAASIGRHGLLQPVIVRRAPAEVGAGEGPGERGGAAQAYRLIAGERRLRAMRRLGRRTIPAIVSEGDPVELALIENLQREDLDPFEEARAISRLMAEKGYSQGEVGQAIGRKQNTVSALLSLLRLPERIREEYPTSDNVAKSWLIELAQIDDEKRQLKLWDQAKNRRVTVREVREARKAGAAITTTTTLARSGQTLARRLETIDADEIRNDRLAYERLEKLYELLKKRLGK